MKKAKESGTDGRLYIDFLNENKLGYPRNYEVKKMINYQSFNGKECYANLNHYTTIVVSGHGNVRGINSIGLISQDGTIKEENTKGVRIPVITTAINIKGISDTQLPPGMTRYTQKAGKEEYADITPDALIVHLTSNGLELKDKHIILNVCYTAENGYGKCLSEAIKNKCGSDTHKVSATIGEAGVGEHGLVGGTYLLDEHKWNIGHIPTSILACHLRLDTSYEVLKTYVSPLNKDEVKFVTSAISQETRKRNNIESGDGLVGRMGYDGNHVTFNAQGEIIEITFRGAKRNKLVFGGLATDIGESWKDFNLNHVKQYTLTVATKYEVQVAESGDEAIIKDLKIRLVTHVKRLKDEAMSKVLPDVQEILLPFTKYKKGQALYKYKLLAEAIRKLNTKNKAEVLIQKIEKILQVSI